MLSNAQILDRVWNDDFGGQANVVELSISYLRKKMAGGILGTTVTATAEDTGNGDTAAQTDRG